MEENEHFGVTVATADGIATVAVTGELDVASVDTFRGAVAQALADCDRIAIDLRELEFVDSSGLRAIVAIHNASESEPFSYSVIAGPRQVHRTFELAGLDQVIAFA